MGYFEPGSYYFQNDDKPWSYSSDADTMRFEVHSGDRWADDVGKERSEIASLKTLNFDRTYTITYQFMVEPGASNTAGFLTMGQMHASLDPNDGSFGPTFAIGLAGENMEVLGRSTTEATTTVEPNEVFHYTDAAAIQRGHWYDMKIEIRFDPFGNGLVNLWRDGVQIVSYAGALGYADETGPYWKVGAYREAADEAFAVDFKDVNVVGEGLPPPVLGTDGDDDLFGGWETEKLYGFDGNDALNGGKLADKMFGGTGDDRYVVDDTGDVVSELVNGTDAGGLDLVRSYIDYTLGSFVEQLALLGTRAIDGAGNGLANQLEGNGAANVLMGRGGDDEVIAQAGDDTLLGGDGNDVLSGGEGTDLLKGGPGDDSVNGDGGNDTLYGGDGDDVLRGRAGIDLAIGGSGNDDLNGDDGDDQLYGRDGNDTLRGDEGADLMNGGAGDDVYHVDNASDQVIETVGGGMDTVYASASYALRSSAEVEILRTDDTAGTDAINLAGNGFDNTIIGNAGNNNIIGGSGFETLRGLDGDDTVNGGGGNDALYGGNGNDTLKGSLGDDGLRGEAGDDVLLGGAGNDSLRGDEGADAMDGGAGDDTYRVDNASDQVTEAVGGGIDTVYASASYALSSSAEVETLRTDDTAGTDAINLTGNSFDNSIIGNAGNNNILGAGGTDTLRGQDGDDTLNGGDGNDVLYGGNGNDTLKGSLGDDDLSGDAGNDVLLGGDGNDTLRGDEGADAMDGGAGDDTYRVDNASDQVTEAVGGGADTIYASASYALSSSAEVETLRTATTAGTDAINLTGNGFDNSIIGNAGNNNILGADGSDTLRGQDGDDTLNGGDGNDALYGGDGNDTLKGDVGDDDLSGDAGDDVLLGGDGNDSLRGDEGSDAMDGGAGDDVYRVDNASDQVTEAVGGGADTIYASASYALSSSAEVETLRTADTAGTDAINLTGNSFDNIIRGNAGSNVLNGGAGIDQLFGNGGDDAFLFSNLAEAGDKISDFGLGNDTIYLDHAGFGVAGTGSTDAVGVDFVLGNEATSANETLIYNSANGQLQWDADGTGTGGKALIAVLTNHVALSANDFLFI